MKAYLFDVFKRFKRFSESLDVRTELCEKTWVAFNDTGERELFIFQSNGEVLITKNGKGITSSWKWIPANHTLIIYTDEEKKQFSMFHTEYIDGVVLGLSLDGTEEYAFLIEDKNKQSFAPQSLTELQNYFEAKELLILAAEKRLALEAKLQREREQREAEERALALKLKQEQEQREKELYAKQFSLLNDAYDRYKSFYPSFWEYILSMVSVLVGGVIGMIIGFSMEEDVQGVIESIEEDVQGVIESIIGLVMVFCFFVTSGGAFYHGFFYITIRPLIRYRLRKYLRRNPSAPEGRYLSKRWVAFYIAKERVPNNDEMILSVEGFELK